MNRREIGLFAVGCLLSITINLTATLFRQVAFNLVPIYDILLLITNVSVAFVLYRRPAMKSRRVLWGFISTTSIFVLFYVAMYSLAALLYFIRPRGSGLSGI